MINSENSKQIMIPRKNHSLPRTLTSLSQNNNNRSIRSRKFMSSSSQLSYNEQKLGIEHLNTAINLEKYEDGEGSTCEAQMQKGL